MLTELDIGTLMAAVAKVTKDYVEHAMAPLRAEIATLKADLAQRPTAEAHAAIVAQAAIETAAMARPADGKSVTVEDVRPMLEKMVAAIPRPRDGVDGVAGRDGVDGKDADEDVVVRRVLERIPIPTDGKDGAPGAAGRDGKDASPIDEDALAARVFRMIPPPREGIDGKDGRDGIDGINALVDYEAIATEVVKAVAEEVAKLPPPKEGAPGRDGTSVHPDTVRLMIVEAVEQSVAKAVERMPAPRDGKDADPHELERAASAEVARQIESILPFIKGEPGPPGLGFDDVTGILDDDGFALRFARGDAVKDVRLPITLYGGVWKAGNYRQGACMTYGGSLWVARRDTSGIPGKSDDWQLAVKRGQDAK